MFIENYFLSNTKTISMITQEVFVFEIQKRKGCSSV